MAIDTDPLCYLTATEATALFRSKQLSPLELMDSVIARCEAVDPKISALTYTFFDRAREQAKAATQLFATGATTRPLEGIPFAVKDFHALAGEITSYGSHVYAGVRSAYTVPTVERLLAAGAIVHARTRTPEFAHCGTCHSPLWGVTRNPWNLAFSPGGSSGGASSAVATGMTVIADGTDAGGSVRIPASASGVFGYKPPFGRLPLDRDHPLESILSYGPLTRSVADAALMQNIMSGPHQMDITALPKFEIPTELAGIAGWRIAVSRDLDYVEMDGEVDDKTSDAIAVFESLGCRVDEVRTGWSADVLTTWETYFEGLCAGLMADLLPRWGDQMDPFLVTVIERGLRHDAVGLYRTNLARAEMWRSLSPVFDHYDVLICPTLAVPSVVADHDNGNANFTINGKTVKAHLGWTLTYPFNLLNQLPVATIPNGFAKSGVPIGLQIVGRPFDDVSVFRAASAFEAAAPWRSVHPEI